MLKRIAVSGYKSLRCLDVSLRPLTVLFGPNASGKSNFLDLLQLLSRIATSRTLKESFDPPYRGLPLESFSFGEGGMRALRNEPSVQFTVEADIELSRATVASVERQIGTMKRPQFPGDRDQTEAGYVRERNLRYRVAVEILPQSGILRVVDEYLAALNARGEPKKSRQPFFSRSEDRIHLRMERQAHPTFIEVGLDHSVLSRPHYPPHFPHAVAVREELAAWQFFYFEPRERMRALNPLKEVRHIGPMGEELASFLNTLRAADERQFRAVERALHDLIPAVSAIELDVNDFGEVELRLREGSVSVPARVVSEGTLRVLGMLALSGAKEPPTLIGFEEPENGVHPRRVQGVARLLETLALTADTQLIVTTHSPLLVDTVPQESLFVCRKEGQCSSIEPFEPWGDLGRRSDAESALEEGPTPVSDRILRGDFDHA